ncbi:MAG: hypothetical protein K6B28_08870 [Lachnospiraceae bacterium]|nr:hypothetical protein [Lachnospiraceae bacterium]
MNDYDSYLLLSRESSLKTETAENILKGMNKCISDIRSEDKKEYYIDMLKKAFRYTSIRCEWELMSRNEMIENDSLRTAYHNDFITSLNILARLAANEGIDSSWRESLGDNRKRIGDFACYITYITGISNR